MRSSPEYRGLCLEAHDLCAAKMARNDTKDREFVAALISTGLVHKHVVHERIEAIRDERFGSQQRQMSLDALRGL